MLKINADLDGGFGCRLYPEFTVQKPDFLIAADRHVHGSPWIEIQMVVETEGIPSPERQDVCSVLLSESAGLLCYLAMPCFKTRPDPPAFEAVLKIIVDNVGIDIEFIVFITRLGREIRRSDVRTDEAHSPPAVACHNRIIVSIVDKGNQVPLSSNHPFLRRFVG